MLPPGSPSMCVPRAQPQGPAWRRRRSALHLLSHLLCHPLSYLLGHLPSVKAGA